jgi:iron complex outermembrane receptor protein
VASPLVASAKGNEGVFVAEATGLDDVVADSAGAAPVAADKNKTDQAQTGRPGGIEEITVTARKREENLQDTPIAVTAFTETDLVDQDIRRIQDINSNVPTLQFDSAVSSSSSARIFLRGVGNGDPISSDDPGVGVYIDGAYLPRAQGALLTVSDIQRVEVLRGPQGTLFGKNTIGGAINIVTQKPDMTEVSGRAEVRVGNYDRFDSRFSINVPLVPERAAARFSFATANRDGFVKNKGTGRDLQDDKLLAGRAQFLFVPSERVEISLSGDHSIERRTPPGGKCFVENRRFQDEAGFGQTPMMGQVMEDGDGVLESAPAARAFSAAVGLPLVQQGAALTDPTGNLNNFFRACAADGLRDERSVDSDLTFNRDYLKTFGTNGTVTFDVTENMTFKAITSWQRRQVEQNTDLDYTGLSLAQATLDAGGAEQDSLSQEFQLTGSGMDDRLNYVVGVYGFKETNDNRAYAGVATTTPLLFTGVDPRFVVGVPGQGAVPFGTAFSNPANAQLRSDFLGTAVAIDPTAMGGAFPAQRLITQADIDAAIAAGRPIPTPFVPGAITETKLKVDNISYAAYSQATYDFTEKLSGTIGLRFTHERKRVANQVLAVTPGTIGRNIRRAGEVNFQFERSRRFSDFSPMANLSYKATDDMLVYANFSKGFKSGGFNGRANAPELTVPIDDEKVTAYEVGIKSSWFDNLLLLNVAGFFNVYEGIQLTIPSGGGAQAQILVLNAGEAHIRGAEIEARARPLDGLELTTSLGVVNADYVEFDDPTNLRAKDRRLPATPNYTMNFAAAYQIPVSSLGDLRLRAEWAHRGRSGTDVVDSRLLRKSKHGELDATIGFMFADGVTEVVLFGNNLLNRQYFTNGVSLGASIGNVYRFYNDPRTYGLEVRRRF